VLVRAERLLLDAKAVREKQVLSVVETEIEDVSERIRELKRLQREAGGKSAREFNQERRRLAKVATLLCAVRAAARGRVHGKGTLESQAKWIEQNAHIARGGPGSESVALTVDRWEIAVEEGQRVEVEGQIAEEAIPATLAASDGYRSRPTARVLRAPRGLPLRVVGMGEISASRTEVAPATRAQKKVLRDVDPEKTRRWILAIALGLSFVAIWIWLTR
jgi:hypothetical protein